MPSDIRHTAHARYSLWYHFAWATKYRKRIWTTPVQREAVKRLLRKIAREYDMEIGTIECLPDHLHLTLSAPPRIAPGRAAQILKSVSTQRLFEYYPALREKYWGGELWVGDYCRSVPRPSGRAACFSDTLRKMGKSSSHEGLKKSAHASYRTKYHLVWIPKYRRGILTKARQSRLGELLAGICERYGSDLDTHSVQEDHVHCFLSFPPHVSIAEAVNVLKGVSAERLREEFPELHQALWGAHLWAPGYYAATVGDRTTAAQIRRYIQNHEWAKDQPTLFSPPPKATDTAAFRPR